jgi:chromosome partitioning protein
MRTILIANPKGGSGKTTLATNLVAHLAREGERVVLGDMDRQQSSLTWLKARPKALPRIHDWNVHDDPDTRPPRLTTTLVLDSPAGLHGKKLAEAVKEADRIIVPVQPSMFDMWATREFLETVLEEKAVKKGRTFVAMVGMRVDARTRSALLLEEFLQQFDLPVLAHLRDTQVYVQAAAAGLSIFDLPPSRAEKDWEQWQPLLEWLQAPE